ncbi:unnamed protein product [Schistosoma curassoni]|uniref:Secreted protein n=1 Tax=Schistosoma curassoni TaxID=6186 RepID=A0A183K458_9TREM|nr:unnamed protein product [Schistosoma curassoni]
MKYCAIILAPSILCDLFSIRIASLGLFNFSSCNLFKSPRRIAFRAIPALHKLICFDHSSLL